MTTAERIAITWETYGWLGESIARQPDPAIKAEWRRWQQEEADEAKRLEAQDDRNQAQ